MSSNYKDVYNGMEMSDNDEQGYSSSESSTNSTDEMAADLKATQQEVGPIEGGGRKAKKKPAARGRKKTKARSRSRSRSRSGSRSRSPSKPRRRRKKKRRVSGGAKRDMSNSPFMRAQLMSNELHNVLGGAPTRPRPHVVKELWAYIKKHNLQDPANRRNINCDEALRNVFGKSSVNMFEMQKILSSHLRAAE